MAKLTNIKRIVKEEFDQEEQELIEKLAFSLNPFMEQISNAFSKNINFDNINQQISEITIETGTTADVLSPTIDLKYTLKTRLKGLHCIQAVNLNTTTVNLTGAPFASYDVLEDRIRINRVTGIPANSKWRLTFILIGE